MSHAHEDGIRATLLNYMNGWLARDIDALMRLFDQEDPDVTYVPAELEAPVFGHAALRAYAEQVSKNFPIISGTFGDLAVRPFGDRAYAVGHIDWRFKAGDVEFTTRIRTTAVLRQRGGTWYLVHMHESIKWQPGG
jgi:ketosteroid isomerase-like protein